MSLSIAIYVTSYILPLGKKIYSWWKKYLKQKQHCMYWSIFFNHSHTLHNCFVISFSSPSHFWLLVFSVSSGRNLESRSICWSWFSLHETWKKVCGILSVNFQIWNISLWTKGCFLYFVGYNLVFPVTLIHWIVHSLECLICNIAVFVFLYLQSYPYRLHRPI